MTQSIKTSIGRLYKYENDWLPSVTTILEYSKPAEQRSFLYNFKKNNEDYVEQAISGGILLHDAIEQYLIKGNLPNNLPDNLKAAFDIIQPFLNTLNVLYTEQPLVYLEGGYAGTLDCIAYEGSTLLLIDWKTAIKHKDKVAWGTYPAQLAAYIQAANSVLELPEPITQGKVIKMYQDGIHSPHVYHLTPSKYVKNLYKFNKAKETYYNLLKYLIKHNQL